MPDGHQGHPGNRVDVLLVYFRQRLHWRRFEAKLVYERDDRCRAPSRPRVRRESCASPLGARIVGSFDGVEEPVQAIVGQVTGGVGAQ